MWLPLTSLTLCFAALPPASERVRPTQGPLALTTPRASTVTRSPDARSASTASQPEPPGARETHAVRVRTSAPLAWASRAFSTTSRESCTQQSEYSKARR